ncbi:hypothetical protein WMF18_40590 [Sorangium sp. So ce315]|uniref:hypothetical protein n=1 Tax=Sorangium sp. So ce315 TaxID=3133299 RepID=UPI003F630ED8
MRSARRDHLRFGAYDGFFLLRRELVVLSVMAHGQSAAGLAIAMAADMAELDRWLRRAAVITEAGALLDTVGA